LLVLTVCGVFFGSRIWFVLRREMYREEESHLHEVPQPLDLSRAAAANGTIEIHGWRFEVPWSGLRRRDPVAGTVVYEDGSGRELVVMHPGDRIDLRGPFLEDEELKEWLRSETLATDQTMFRAILEARPDDIHLFTSQDDFYRGYALVQLKDLFAPWGKTGIYEFRAGDVQGFQLGDPVETHRVNLHAFGPEDHWLEMWLSVPEGSDLKLTQMEINRLLGSLRRGE
jgi:hypothetical protein